MGSESQTIGLYQKYDIKSSAPGWIIMMRYIHEDDDDDDEWLNLKLIKKKSAKAVNKTYSSSVIWFGRRTRYPFSSKVTTSLGLTLGYGESPKEGIILLYRWRRETWTIAKKYKYQEPINRSLHMHCILESTFGRIFLFLELPFLQEAQFYRENLSQSSSLEEFPDLPAITVTFCRDHFMWGNYAALFWLGILNSARESSHPQCSKNKKIRAKVDSEGLYGRGRLLFMCSCKYLFTDGENFPQNDTVRPPAMKQQKWVYLCVCDFFVFVFWNKAREISILSARTNYGNFNIRFKRAVHTMQ